MSGEKEKYYFFIDEGGDSSFYAKRKKLMVGTPGFQPMLNLGMVALADKKGIRKSIVDFMDSIKSDPLYNGIYSVSQPGWYLHACNDHPEIRAKFFEFLRKLEGYKIYIIIGRKRLSTFKNKHNNNEKEFYFDLVYHLLKDRLNKEDLDYRIFLSARQKSTQKHLDEAISMAIARDNTKRKEALDIGYSFDIVRSQDTPELSIIDYFLWALHRLLSKAKTDFIMH